MAMGLPVDPCALEPCALDIMVDPRESGRVWVETCARFRRLAQYLHRLAGKGQIRVPGPGGKRICEYVQACVITIEKIENRGGIGLHNVAEQTTGRDRNDA